MKRNDIEQLLPLIFQRTLRGGSPLSAILDVMETLHAPNEALLRDIASFFNPYETRDDFVAYLAGWVDLKWVLTSTGQMDDASPAVSTGLGRLRELIAAAAYLSKWRGTRKGLESFLNIATGCEHFQIDEHPSDDRGQDRPFHIRVKAPAPTRRHRELIQRIIEREKPAYVTYDLVFEEDPQDDPESRVDDGASVAASIADDQAPETP